MAIKLVLGYATLCSELVALTCMKHKCFICSVEFQVTVVELMNGDRRDTVSGH